jgi:hypothetical protein
MADLPSVGDIVGPIYREVAASERPLLIASAERLAASRYRAWAQQAPATQRDALLACAAREEEIAALVESLFVDAARIGAELRDKHGALGEAYETLFEGRPLADQYAIQAHGERLGAATWRGLAATDARPEAKHIYLTCATFEEASAEVLESLIAESP